MTRKAEERVGSFAVDLLVGLSMGQALELMNHQMWAVSESGCRVLVVIQAPT